MSDADARLSTESFTWKTIAKCEGCGTVLACGEQYAPTVDAAVRSASKVPCCRLWHKESKDEFVLDKTENPHPTMLGGALRTRARARNRPWDPDSAAEWRGYLQGMVDATGCAPDEIEAWMDRNDLPDRGH